jgi:uroporphyrinogen decarboxylase
MSGVFQRALQGDPLAVPPVWLMRQAGRYHAPYQRLRAQHGFEALCRTPELAAEVAMAPVLDFDFDAAILFSDLLFPLEALGFGLSYDTGPPQLDGPLTVDRLARFRPLDEAVPRLAFQRDALAATRERLSADKGLVGFVGGPWTLFVYAVEGTHLGTLERAKALLDLYRAFADRIVPLLVATIRLQLEGGADVVMIFDTAAGELAPEPFQRELVSDLCALARAFPRRLGYYAKGLRPAHIWGNAFTTAPWAGLSLDSEWNLAAALTVERMPGFVQGNFDPTLLLLTGAPLARAIQHYLDPLCRLDAEARRGWVCGLGHGVLPRTPESSVRTFVQTVRETFA